MTDVEIIGSFCDRYNLVWCIDTTTISPMIVGLYEARVYCFDEARKLLAIELCPDDLDFWPSTRTRLLKAGFDLVHEMSFEAVFAFDSQNDRQRCLAVEMGGFVPVEDSAAQRATMRQIIMSARQRKAAKAAARELTRQRKCAKLGIDYYDADERAASLDWLHCGTARMSRPAASF